jgi:two-component system cell cycle response regulator
MGFKVLTVDDSKTLRMIVRSALAPFGVNVIEAENGALGLDTARAEKPDLVLLD